MGLQNSKAGEIIFGGVVPFSGETAQLFPREGHDFYLCCSHCAGGGFDRFKVFFARLTFEETGIALGRDADGYD